MTTALVVSFICSGVLRGEINGKGWIFHSSILKRGEKTMNKGDLVNEVAKAVCTKKEAQEVVGR